MIRFAGNGAVPTFEGLTFSGTGGQGIAGAGKAAARVGEIFNSFGDKKYGDIADAAVMNAAKEDAVKMQAEADVLSTGAAALGGVMSMNIQADAYEESAQTQADAYEEIAEKIEKSAKKSAEKSRQGSIIGALGTVASVALPLLSDERTKHTIEKLDDVTLMLRELNPVSFYYKDEYTNDPERMHYGFIAQEYQNVMPDAVHIDSDSGMYRIDINQLIALLVRGYQQLDNRITRMEVKSVLAGVS